MTGHAERINADVWRSRRVLGVFAGREGWIDEGEALLAQRVVEECGAFPILDIGVGAGRTIPYLHSASREYVAVDFLEEMVSLARSRHPDARVEQADARDLSAFAGESFGAVFFSYNGIDGIPHDDRCKVHASVRRVLRPGGVFAYSTHNLDWAPAGRPPWDRCWWDVHKGPRAALAFGARLPSKSRSFRRLRGLTRRGDGWATLVGSGYDFSVLWHHVDLHEAQQELVRAGYVADVEVSDPTGVPVHIGEDTREASWFYLLARKAKSPPGGT